jgi:hypothetical protein
MAWRAVKTPATTHDPGIVPQIDTAVESISYGRRQDTASLSGAVPFWGDAARVGMAAACAVADERLGAQLGGAPLQLLDATRTTMYNRASNWDAARAS